MTFKKNALVANIKKLTDVAKLTYLRDYGIDKILLDPNISVQDFNEADRDEFVILINNRIAELGA